MLHTVQVCRAIAALLVVLFHTAGNLAKERYFGKWADPLEHLFYFGGEAGVAFFFVLSGFIIHHVHFRDFDRPGRLGAYLKKRAIRVYPTYMIVFAAVFLCAKAVPALRDTVPSDPMVLLKALLLIPQDSAVVGGTGAPVIIVAWSLHYEILFYLVFGLALVRRWLFYLVAGALVVNFLAVPFSEAYDFPRSFLANPLIMLFGLGVLSSMAVRSKWSPAHARWLVAASCLGFAMMAVLATWYHDQGSPRSFSWAYGLFSACLIFSLVRSETQTMPGLAVRRLGTVGEASYALYLIHFPLVAVASKLAVKTFPLNGFGVVASFLCIVLACILASMTFNRWIERPFLSQLNRRFQTRHIGAQPA